MGSYLLKPESFFDVFDRKEGNPTTTHYCPGCGHGIVHKLLAEAIDDLGIQDRTLLIASIGCSVFIYYYFQVSAVSSAHGRAPAVGTAVSRAWPDGITVAYQGDGDLAAIGTSHILHAANRGENMIVLFINNNVYGMTGGQLAPTSLLGQKTLTSSQGRSLLNDGAPLKMSELIAQLDAPVLVARSAVSSPAKIRETKRLLARGLKAQVDKKGFVFLEILSPCPTNWHKSPVDSCRWIEDEVCSVFPTGIFKDEIDHRFPQVRLRQTSSFSKAIETLGIKTITPIPETKSSLPKPEYKITIAGFGGQGVLSLGAAMATLGMKKGWNVTWLPSYGPEMRGGVAHCSVVLSRHPIGSPLTEHPDLLIAMNKPSLGHFAPLVSEEGVIFYNQTLTDQLPPGIVARTYPLEATSLAMVAGEAKMANTVFLAAVSKELQLFTREELEGYIQETFKQSELCEKNLSALDRGWNVIP